MNIVTKRFVEAFDHLKNENRVRSGRQFAVSLDYLPQSFSEILNGRRDVTIELLRKSVEKYQINPAFLFLGQEPMFIEENTRRQVRTITIVTDAANRGNLIPHVPLHAQTQYLTQSGVAEFMQRLPVLSLPDAMLAGRQMRSFDVADDQMEPTLTSGDKVLSALLMPSDWLNELEDQQVYVVVTVSGVLVRRVVNLLQEKKCLELWSDNSVYDPYFVPMDDILEIWAVQQRISSFLPHPRVRRSSVADDIREIKYTVQHQALIITELQQQFSKINHTS
jgi:hypothetical protein